MEIAKIVVDATTGRCISRKRIPAGIVGATVLVKFCDPIWDKLNKTVIFRGTDSKIAEFDGQTAIVPWEVLEQPGTLLCFGIWGSDPDSDLQLPLIEVDIGVIEAATDPNADPGTDPTLPIWAQLQQDVEQLKQGGTGGTGAPGKDGADGGYYTPGVTQIDDNTIQIDFTPSQEDMPAVNPVTVELPMPDSGGNADYVVQDTAPEDTSFLWVDPTDNTDDGFQEAVNAALAQAKESGEFDGADGKDGADGAPGEDGQDYVLTEADKTEIAEMAAGLVEVSESSGGGISITGATVGQTVKISSVDENGVPTAWEPVMFPTDDHINSLIGTALGGIENGAY